MKFWKKYKAKKQLRKAKKELKQKLEKARFINFYDNKIDLSLGKVIKVSCHFYEIHKHTLFDEIFTKIHCFIVLKYDNFIEKELFIGTNIGELTTNQYAAELNNFINSDKFTERLNEYEQLKKEYEKLL
jgi:hypothetical protein